MSCFEHSPLIDASSGTVVCSECAHVLDEGLSYHEVRLPQPFLLKELQQFTPEVEKPEVIHGESAYDLLQKIGDRLNLCQPTIENAFTKFKKTKNLIKFLVKYKKKRAFLSNENILVYSLYVTLKEDSCPRAIKEICYYAGILKPLEVLKIEKFIESQRDSDNVNVKRLRPINAKDIISTHYPYIHQMTFEDTTQIFHRLNCIEPISFSPLVTAAGSVYLYLNFVKNSKQSMLQVSNLFKVSSMSIQRFAKRYKSIF